MKILKRIKWLITQAPTAITEADKTAKKIPCHYCGEVADCIHWHGSNGMRVICHTCFITAMDKVMIKEELEKR